MKNQVLIFCFCLLITFYSKAQTLIANPQNGSGEGGELLLMNSNSNYNSWNIDNYMGHLRFFHSGTVKLNITPVGMVTIPYGNVGIGTSNPSAKLQVEGRTSVGKSGVLNLDWTNDINWGGNSNNWSGYLGFNAYRNNDEVKDNYYGNNPYTSKGVFEGSNYGFRWLFRKVVNNDSQSQHQLSEYMRLDNNGNLGIGTTIPDAKLTVKGNIHTNEVKVDLLGAVAPDYVFYKDYDLKSLQAVEDYIAVEGHLPNIPSAKDMETEGIQLKEMNLKLLEKIEELTLYAIEQEKKIESQEVRLQILEAHLNSKNNKR